MRRRGVAGRPTGRFAGRVAGGVALALAALACGGEPAPRTAEGPSLRSVACRALDAPATVPLLPPEGLALPADVSPNGGISFAEDAVFVLDVALGHLWRLDATGRVERRAGRSGRGPGEFDPRAGVGAFGAGRFLERHGDTLVASDGRSVHRFTTALAPLDSRPIPPSAISFLEIPVRIGLLDGQAIVESWTSVERGGGGITALPNRTFTLWRVDGDTVAPVERVTLPQLPRTATGGFFGSPAEARPVWDLRDGCLALMDGHAPRLVLGDLRTGLRDTIQLPLPERYADPVKANAGLPGIRPGVELPAPALLARVHDLVLDPSGVVWLRPAAAREDPAARLEVWTYDLRSGRFAVDSAAGFPRTFDASGTAIRVRIDDEGVTRLLPLARLRDATAPPPGH